ncbi:MAG: pro-sigmaK processing inhibitor BofA family protein [Bacilli bacterium]|nr:pro-sigmaK processing inhibitor BofA family protein [Bacilli bacterium]
MLKKILKKLIFSITSIYFINIFLNTINIFIPFNYISIAISYFLGIPGLIAMILVSIIV